MKILIVSQYFWPENFKINDLVVELKNSGHNVTVLTGKPNYPEGKIYSGYSFWGYKKDKYKGVEIIRVPLIPRGNSAGYRLAINYFSFIVFGSIYFLINKKKFDVSLTYAVSPLTAAYPALLHKKLYKSKVFLWVQDLWPESITAAGNIKSKIIIKCLDWMVKHIYSYSDKILTQSEAFKEAIVSKGVDPNKLKYLPNWAEDLFINPIISKDRYKYLIPEGFIIMFAGNIGEAQDFNSLLKAAELTKSQKRIKWVIIGDGRRRNFVNSEIKRLGIEDTFFTLGRFPIEEMPNLFVHANVMLISLKSEYIFSLTIPSKVQSYMAFGKPILSMMNGIGSNIIDKANCGYTGAAGNYATLAKNALIAFNEPYDSLEMKGRNGKEYYLKNFSKDKIIASLVEIFNS
ncbi:MAG: glycosyltransferase family 4 protein [Bacteroidales bacterium]|nr:glycosyltransferase family 4 protein [Bacteroidales bacterium]